MIRTFVTLAAIGALVWAPWMGRLQPRELAEMVASNFGPLPAGCFDGDGDPLASGVAVRWYPFGRLVHTCARDYVHWMWGGVSELGGVYKGAPELGMTSPSPLTCRSILERRAAKRASSTQPILYGGDRALHADFSAFPDTEGRASRVDRMLRDGPTFAGRYTVASWDCGTNCQRHAVADVASGRVIAYGLPTEYGVSYDLASNLLVTNPVQHLPELPADDHEAEDIALSLARLPREYYEVTYDAASDSAYLVRVCVEGSITDYLEVAGSTLQTEHPQ